MWPYADLMVARDLFPVENRRSCGLDLQLQLQQWRCEGAGNDNCSCVVCHIGEVILVGLRSEV